MPAAAETPELQPCPICSGKVTPQISRGARSKKFFLTSTEGCEHVWTVINYQNVALTEAEARDRWNAWVWAQPKKGATETPSPSP